MSMDAPIALARLIAELKAVAGRKRLQKIVHLLRASGSPDFRYRFILHYFGPYSRGLASDLDFLCAANIVKEVRFSDGSYRYSIDGEEGEKRIHDLTGGTAPEMKWASLATKLNNEDMPLLEALSTIRFLVDRGHEGDKLRGEFTTAKPHLVEHLFEKALKRGVELELLSA